MSSEYEAKKQALLGKLQSYQLPKCNKQNHRDRFTSICIDTNCKSEVHYQCLCEECQFCNVHKRQGHATGSIKFNLRQVIEQCFEAPEGAQGGELLTLRRRIAADIEFLQRTQNLIAEQIGKLAAYSARLSARSADNRGDIVQLVESVLAPDLGAPEFEQSVAKVFRQVDFDGKKVKVRFEKRAPTEDEEPLNSEAISAQLLVIESNLHQIEELYWEHPVNEISRLTPRQNKKKVEYDEDDQLSSVYGQTINQETADKSEVLTDQKQPAYDAIDFVGDPTFRCTTGSERQLFMGHSSAKQSQVLNSSPLCGLS